MLPTWPPRVPTFLAAAWMVALGPRNLFLGRLGFGMQYIDEMIAYYTTTRMDAERELRDVLPPRTPEQMRDRARRDDSPRSSPRDNGFDDAFGGPRSDQDGRLDSPDREHVGDADERNQQLRYLSPAVPDRQHPAPDASDEDEEDEIQVGGGQIPPRERTAVPDDEDAPDVDFVDPSLEMLRDAKKWLDDLSSASVENDSVSEAVHEALQNPVPGPYNLDKTQRYCMREFLNIETVERYYESMQCLREYDPDTTPLSHHQIKSEVEQETGIVPVWVDMCSESCVAFTGPYQDLEQCPQENCGRPRYRDKRKASGRMERVPVKRCLHIPVGPQLSNLYTTPQSADDMDYRRRLTTRLLGKLARNETYDYEDYCASSTYLDLARDGSITDDDIVLSCSLDGAQLYRDKKSDCWILIWINMNLPPSLRYQKKYIMIGAIIPGPNKPKHIDSFMYTSLYHLAVLQKTGFKVWNARKASIESKGLYFWLALADGPGLALMSGLVPHHGGKGCRIHCGLPGRRKTNQAPTYYPVLRKPDPPYNVRGSAHDTIEIDDIPQPSVAYYTDCLQKIMAARTDAEYKRVRLQTGIVKPSIFSSLPRSLPVPFCFGVDATMHVLGINIPDLMVNLFLGRFICEGDDKPEFWPWACFYRKVEEWKLHGALVAACRCFFPGSFDRAPRNIAEKFNSGYKAWEFILYFYGLLPALLFEVLEDRYWEHLCHLIAGARIFMQHKVPYDQVAIGHQHLRAFVQGFENEYYQGRSDRIHFVRQSIHILLHFASELIRVGPGAYTSQWPLERTIGNLGEEVRQHSTFFENLCERALWRDHKNAIKIKFNLDADKKFRPRHDPAPVPGQAAPNAHPATSLPHGAVDCGEGYVLLRARDETPFEFTGKAGEAVTDFMEQIDATDVPDGYEYRPSYRRFARLRLPNGQIARSEWKEGTRVQDRIRRSRMVKTLDEDGETHIVEVRAYFRARVPDADDGTTSVPFALVSKFSKPDETLLRRSHGVLHVATYQGEDDLGVIPVQDIKSVVAMIPFQHHKPGDHKKRYFLVEKPGLEILWWGVSDEDRVAGMEGDG
ncbi:unnamed protein product [Peniophora sp. CBMAI 1063]|nr:unnamed protein product [Peniophora sp. CBMAI 1063]